MITISEWLPNPKGSDAKGEWVELFNSGAESVPLHGYRLTTGKGKGFLFSNQTISAGEHLVLPRETTKLSLINTDGSLVLFDASGAKVDIASFIGQAPEGKSVSRAGERFSFGEPTPGAENKVVLTATIYPVYASGTTFVKSWSASSFILATVFLGFTISCLTIMLIKRNHDLSELFFESY